MAAPIFLKKAVVCPPVIALAISYTHAQSSSRILDYDLHLGGGHTACTMRQVKAGVEDRGSSGGHFGAHLFKPTNVIHFGVGATCRLFKEDAGLPYLHTDLDFIGITHQTNYTAHRYDAQSGTFIRNYIVSGEGVNSLRLAPSLRMARTALRGVNFYSQAGPAFHFMFPLTAAGRYSYFFWRQESRHFLALSGELGFGYRDFFIYGSYDHGLTPYGYGRSLTGDRADDFVQKYRVVRVGLSYHPKLTKRLRRAEGMQRRASPRQ